MINLDEIRERAEKADAGPWHNYKQFVMDSYGDRLFSARTYKNAEFVSHARTDIPALCDEVDRLTAENADLHAKMVVFMQKAESLEKENEKIKPFYKVADDTFKHWKNAAYAMRDEERARANQVALNYQQKCRDVAELEKKNAVLKAERDELKKALASAKRVLASDSEYGSDDDVE